MGQTSRSDGVVGNEGVKVPCLLATTTNITLSGTQTIDGVNAVTGDRVLVKDQTDTTENGIYTVKTDAWVRASDWNGARDVKQGTVVAVSQGSVSARAMYQVTTADPIVGDAIAIQTLIVPGGGGLATTTFSEDLLLDANAGEARTTFGLGALATTELDDTYAWSGVHTHTGLSPLVFDGAVAGGFKTTFTFVEPTADRVITFPNSSVTIGANSAVVIQQKYVQDGVRTTGTTVMVDDNTIPQSTEGTQFMSLAITPTDAANILEIEVVAQFSASVATQIIMALFKDAVANALSVGSHQGDDEMLQLTIRHRIVAGSTSAQTFKIRCGGSSASTIRFNGASGSLFGGVYTSSITITELTP